MENMVQKLVPSLAFPRSNPDALSSSESLREAARLRYRAASRLLPRYRALLCSDPPRYRRQRASFRDNSATKHPSAKTLAPTSASTPTPNILRANNLEHAASSLQAPPNGAKPQATAGSGSVVRAHGSYAAPNAITGLWARSLALNILR